MSPSGERAAPPPGAGTGASPVCIVTGAATGIGAATVVELVRTVGARVVLASLPDDDFAPVAAAVAELGGECLTVAADVRLPGDCEAMVATALERFGQLDLVHVNAGYVDQSTVAGGDPARWRRVVETNLLGAAYTVRAALPAMIERGQGHVIFTASLSGREAYVGEPLYVASKWGVVGFGNALRLEVNPLGIRVTLIEPGLVDTPFTRNSPVIAPLLDGDDPLQPEDIARAVVYAYLQPPYVNVNEIAIAPIRQRSLGPEELAQGLAELAAKRHAEAAAEHPAAAAPSPDAGQAGR